MNNQTLLHADITDAGLIIANMISGVSRKCHRTKQNKATSARSHAAGRLKSKIFFDFAFQAKNLRTTQSTLNVIACINYSPQFNVAKTTRVHN